MTGPLVLNGGCFCLWEHMAASGDMSNCHTGVGVLLASSGWMPGVLLNILQCTEQPPHQRIIPPQMSMVLRLWNPRLDGVCTLEQLGTFGKCPAWISPHIGGIRIPWHWNCIHSFSCTFTEHLLSTFSVLDSVLSSLRGRKMDIHIGSTPREFGV